MGVAGCSLLKCRVWPLSGSLVSGCSFDVVGPPRSGAGVGVGMLRLLGIPLFDDKD